MENNTKIKDLPNNQPDGWYAFPDQERTSDDDFVNMLSFYYIEGYMFGPVKIKSLSKMEIVKFQEISHYLVENLSYSLTKVNIKEDKDNLQSFDLMSYLQGQNVRLTDVATNPRKNN